MLSRTACSIYWMSRYLERADNVARSIAVNAHLILDTGLEREQAQWEPLVNASGDVDDFFSRYENPDEQSVIHFLTFDEKNPNSIISCVRNARENARTLREVISSEMWESLNALHHLVDRQSRSKRVDHLHEFHSNVRTAYHLFTGLMQNTMSHNEGWQFACIGRQIERADKTARTLDVKYFTLLPQTDYVDSPYDSVEWGAVLKSVSGFEMYLKQFHRANYRNVTQFLILDPFFPRAIRYCVETAAAALNTITEMLEVEVQACEEMEKLRKMIVEVDIDLVLSDGLHQFIDRFQYNLNIVDNSIHKSFFALESGD